MHQIVPLDMQATPSHSVQAKAIIIAYAVFCFLIYGIGASILSSVPASLFGDFLIKASGLLLIFTGPGLFIAFLFFKKEYTLTEYIAIGFGLNLLLFPSIVALIELAGLPGTARLAISAIALLTFIAAAIWIALDRPAPTLGEIKTTSLRFSLSALCLLAIVLIYPREILTPVDQYISDDSFEEFVELLESRNKAGLASKAFIERPGQLNRYEGTEPYELTWTYINNTSVPQQFAAVLLTNCAWLQLSLSPGKPVEGGSAAGKMLQVDELWGSPSEYFSISDINTVFLDEDFPDRNRVYASEEFVLVPGENSLNIKCLEAQHELRIVDLSTMDRAQLLDSISTHYLVKAEPEVGDVQEAFLESKYATQAVSWINPPLLYPAYRGALEILGTSMRSVTLLELFAFSLVFMMLSLIVAEAQGPLPLGPSLIAMAAMANYVIAITLLPVLHSAAGVFLLMFLAGSWFLWRRDFTPAAGALILMCLLRYEGVVLAALALFAFFAVADHQIRIRNYILFALAAAGLLSFLAVLAWGAEMFKPIALVERIDMLRLMDISPERVFEYIQWAVILSCGMPIFWFLIKKADRLSIYYLSIAALYLGFLCSLYYIRPYHLGPFALAATAAGTRAIMGIGDAAIRKAMMFGFFVLALGSLYLVLNHLPRQVPLPLP
jgi:hypothetical protein